MDMEGQQAVMFPLPVRVDMDGKRNQTGPEALVWRCRLGPDIEHVAARLDAFVRECIQVVLEVPYRYGGRASGLKHRYSIDVEEHHIRSSPRIAECC